MGLKEDFDQAAKQVMNLTTRPSNDILLNLYALYKQATEGDVRGKKPGVFDLKGRKKFEAWEALKGKAKDSAQVDYIALVQSLL